ncbi:MAG: C1 family peptidase [Bacteroidota bacterium]
MKTTTFLLLLFSFATTAQGFLIDEERYDRIPLQSQYNDGSKSENKALEGVKQHSLKAFCPRVQDQGDLATCVGWSVGYAALSILHAVNNDWRGQTDLITKYAFSSHFVFNQIKMGESGCGSGAFVDSALMLLQTRGNLVTSAFDEELEDCSRLPTAEELEEASNNKILDYAMLFKKETAAQIKINKTKLSLLNNQAVILGLMTPRSFVSPKMKGASRWQPRAGERGFFGHALVVVGFDDTKNAFEVMNSWGTEWGDQGFTWMDYEDFAKYAYYAFQMSIDDKKKRDATYTGTFALRRFLGLDQNEKAIFEDIRLKRNRKKYYQINRKEESIQRGSVFQLLVSQVTGGMYLYAFGIESDGTIKHYFPLEGEHPKITVPEVELFLPEREGGLQFNKKGKEHIVLLYSTQAIPDFRTRTAFVTAKNDDLLEQLYTLFNEDMIPLKEINFNKSKIQFDHAAKKAHITPLVLEIDVR